MNRVLAGLMALSLATLACSVNVDMGSQATPAIGPTETETIDVAAPDSESAQLTLAMGAGSLTLTGGGEALVSGTVDYNVTEWKPVVEVDGDAVTVRQGGDTNGNFNTWPGSSVVNDWQLAVGDTPLDLTINAGAYQGNLKLGAVPLRRLEINDGAATANVRFDELNPEEMTELIYKTGASTVTLTGLANANFETLRFDSGAGSYTLDFSGDLQRDATVEISSGVSTLTLIIPEGTHAIVTSDSALSSITTTGEWSTSGSTYTAAGEGPTLTITVDTGVSTLNLIRK
ncbi:MAG TPA: toast rack family protein [Anaerolineales bacterium]|nr:toast rack family protein [Anaerolineales bacterium]